MASRAEQLRMGRISRKMSLAPSLIMATELEAALPDRKPTFQDYLCEHMKTIVTVIMIFGTLAVIVVIVMVHKTRYDEEQAKLQTACLDVAIVGAGLSGAFTAWRLRNDSAKVELFETTDRIGGRLQTYRFGSNPTQNLELGAMYYIPEEHPVMNWTIHALNLHPQSLPQLSPDHAMYYLRGIHLQHQELSGNRTHYTLAPTEMNKSPQNLLNFYLSRTLSNTSFPIIQPLGATTNDGHHLYTQGYSNILSRVASSEGIHYLKDTAFRSSQVEDYNAALLSVLPVTLSPKIRTIAEGMDELPARLAKQFENSSDKHNIRKNMRLACIHKNGELFKLTFIHTETNHGRTTDLYTKSSKQNVCARKVVLAMPRQSLENLDMSDITNGAFIERHMRAVKAVHSTRVYFVYDTPWWRGRRYLSPHHMTTDLPIHRTIDAGSQGYSVLDHGRTSLLDADFPGNSNIRGRHVLMVSDIDGSRTSYLDNIFPNETTYETDISRYATIVRDITQQLARLYRYPIKQVPQPVAIIAKDWKQSPSGSGWDLWRRGVNWLTHAQRMLQPVNMEDMFVVGSAYCSGKCQFYAEGALETVNSLLRWVKDLCQTCNTTHLSV